MFSRTKEYELFVHKCKKRTFLSFTFQIGWCLFKQYSIVSFLFYSFMKTNFNETDTAIGQTEMKGISIIVD